MTPKEKLFSTLRHEPQSEAPWVPFAGVHAGKLLGYDATEVLTDADKLFASLMEVNRLYKPDGQPVVFDLQLEAECLGCELVWAKEGPPSVKTHPLFDENDPEDRVVPCDCTIPDANQGRIPLVLDVMRRMKAAAGDETALYGLICGPFTLASHLRGNDIFMDMYDDEDYVRDLLAYAAKVAKTMAGYYVEAGMDVIAIVDPLISQISTDHFRQFMTDPFTEIFDAIRDLGAFSSFFVCGDATRNIAVMCETGPDSIGIDENINMAEAKTITDRYNVALGGNIPLTTLMLHGNQQDNMKFTVELLDMFADKTNLIISPGCDMPYATPVENAIGVAQAVHQTNQVREMVKNYQRAEMDLSQVVLPDYEHLERPLVEVFTLDSETCAACTYMWGAATGMKARFGAEIDLVEYKFTVKENIPRIVKMGVQQLPSIYVNGKLVYSSLIPSREAFDRVVREALTSTSK